MINFTKMHGLGNDFVVIDNMCGTISLNSEKIKQLSNRNLGIGFDQLLMVETSLVADFKYRIFNANGNEVEQCGNGARCFAFFVHKKNLINKNSITAETLGGIISITIKGKNATVNMGLADFSVNNILHNSKQQTTYTIENQQMGLVSMGNPHAVILVDDINLEINDISVKIQKNHKFINSINVGFMQIIDKSQIKLRVFERGVGETLACGSGACAAVSYGIMLGKLNNNVRVRLIEGDLIIEKIDNNIFLSGMAEFVFDGCF